ncbi:MAG: hypothetical protein V3V49_15140 [Candidatus Krumholzibacteria bacterium]
MSKKVFSWLCSRIVAQRRVVVFNAGIVVLILVQVVGCSKDDDKPTGPGTPSGGSAANLPAGRYVIEESIWECGQSDTSEYTDSELICAMISISEFSGGGCPVQVNGNEYSWSCEVDGTWGDCEYTVRLEATGLRDGDTWTTRESYEITAASPVGCFGGVGDCGLFLTTLTRVGDAPGGCAYAEPNTVQLTIRDGPYAGEYELFASGGATSSGGGISYSLSASIRIYEPEISDVSFSIGFTTPLLDPASLPVTLAVVMESGYPLNVTGEKSRQPEAAITDFYTETGYPPLDFDSFVAESVELGTFTVNELSEVEIAGKFNVVFRGTKNYGTPEQAQRSVLGSYFIDNEPSLSSEKWMWRRALGQKVNSR